MHKYLQSLMKGVARFSYFQAKWVIIVSFIVMLVGVWLSTTRLGVLNDTNALIRQDSPVLRYYLDYLKEFNTRDPILIVVQSGDFQQNKLVAEQLVSRISAEVSKNQVQDIYYRNDLTRLKPHFLLYQSEEELNSMLGQIRAQKSILGQRGKAVNLNSLLDGAIEQFNKVDKAKGKGTTLDDLEAYSDKMIVTLEALAQELARPIDENAANGGKGNMLSADIDNFQTLIEQNEYISFDDGKILLITLTPGVGDNNSFAPYKTGIKKMQDIIAAVKKEYPSVQIGMTGESVLMNDELEQSDKDIRFASIIATLLIALGFFLAYKQLVRPALAMVALIHAILFSLAFTVLVVGHLNIISQAFVLMMLGLGIDFSIQFVGRYEEERRRGNDILKAIENTMQNTGIAIITGGGTTAVAFYTMCFNDFIGLAELGIIAGTGIIFCMFASLVLFPSLITVVYSRRKNGGISGQAGFGNLGSTVDRVLTYRPRLMILVIIAISAFLVWQIDKVKFDYNLLNLQNPKIESLQLANQLTNDPKLPFTFGVLVADDLDHAARLTKELETKESVSNVISINRILPENQEAKLPILKQVKVELDKININTPANSSVNLQKAKTTLNTILEYSLEGQKEAQKWSKRSEGAIIGNVMGKSNKQRLEQALKIFDRLIPALNLSINSLNKLPADEAVRRLNRYEVELIGSMQKQFAFLKGFDFEHPVTLDDLPAQAREHYISPNGKILVEVYPKENVMERDANERFVNDLHSVDEKATGTPVQNYTYISELKNSYQQAALLAFIAIVIMVALHFRNFWQSLLALLPLALGVVWTIGIMGWLGLPFNPANIITLPLVIGIGVAYGIYVMDRYKEEGHCALFTGSTGKAILMSAFTTVIGFGAMMIGDYKGLVSLGMIMSLGVFCCFVTSSMVLSQILVWWDNRRTK